MHRIDTPTAQKDKFGAGKNGYTDGNPQVGTPATDLNAAMFDAMQEELSAIVESTGVELDPGNNAQVLTAIKSMINAVSMPDVGDLYITKNATDPTEKWPGTVWEYLGEGLTLRTAKADLSDLGTTTGADTVTLTAENMPPHAHAIGGATGSSGAATITTSTFDYGSKGSDNPGDHTHTETNLRPADPATVYMRTDGLSAGDITTSTGWAGNHTHLTGIGAHNHTGDVPAHAHYLPAATGNTGGNAEGATSSISTVSNSIMIAVWVRTA